MKIGRRSNVTEIGKTIVEAWRKAIDSGEDPQKWSAMIRDYLRQSMASKLDGDHTNGRKRTVVYDFVFDEDLDDDTRLVWIAVPMPDPSANQEDGSADKAQAWKKYIDDKFSSNSDYAALGRAVLFGCGR